MVATVRSLDCRVRRRISELPVRVRNRDQFRLQRKYAQRSMIPPMVFVDNLLLAKEVTHVPGSVVECGTWRGGMIAALAEELRTGPDREFVLLDSFEGLPAATQVDGETALQWQRDGTSAFYYDNCRAEMEEAQESMRMAQVDARLIKGWFDETVPMYAAETPRIALLRLDADWYESTMTCLRHLFPLVLTGGLVIVDDYGFWDGCTRALHEYLSKTDAAEPIRSTPNGATYLVRR